MKDKFIIAIDQSTSGTKAILFNKQGELIKRCTVDHNQYCPQSGWVEHDAIEIYNNTLKSIGMLIDEAKIAVEQVMAFAITNQRETVVVWDKNTGKPVYNAIVWQCQRAESICRQIAEEGNVTGVRDKTGLVLSPYFSAAKVKWILDNVDNAKQKAENGDLLLGTMDAWLIWKLTEGKVHATDYSNASRTQLFNIHKLEWDDELLKIFTIPKSMLPEVKFSDEIFGYTTKEQTFGSEVPISGVMGDSHAALFGQCCFKTGMVKATYGTGSSVMMNTGDIPVKSENGLVTSLAWGMNGRAVYVIEGNINSTGATIKWMANELELIKNSKESGMLAESVEDNGGVYIVPAFSGLGAPYWDSNARASITGMTFGTTKAHVVRAAEESIAYQINDILQLMIRESSIKVPELRVDGGPTRDNFLMQFQADIIDVSVTRANIEEISAFGSCLMAGIGIGLWDGQEEVQSMYIADKTFSPKMDSETRKKLNSEWKEAVRKTLSKQI